jgi:hypothetical protein
LAAVLAADADIPVFALGLHAACGVGRWLTHSVTSHLRICHCGNPAGRTGSASLLMPFWIGYGFLDYKDIPVATGVIAATY